MLRRWERGINHRDWRSYRCLLRAMLRLAQSLTLRLTHRFPLRLMHGTPLMKETDVPTRRRNQSFTQLQNPATGQAPDPAQIRAQDTARENSRFIKISPLSATGFQFIFLQILYCNYCIIVLLCFNVSCMVCWLTFIHPDHISRYSLLESRSSRYSSVDRHSSRYFSTEKKNFGQECWYI